MASAGTLIGIGSALQRVGDTYAQYKEDVKQKEMRAMEHALQTRQMELAEQQAERQKQQMELDRQRLELQKEEQDRSSMAQVLGNLSPDTLVDDETTQRARKMGFGPFFQPEIGVVPGGPMSTPTDGTLPSRPTTTTVGQNRFSGFNPPALRSAMAGVEQRAAAQGALNEYRMGNLERQISQGDTRNTIAAIAAATGAANAGNYNRQVQNQIEEGQRRSMIAMLKLNMDILQSNKMYAYSPEGKQAIASMQQKIAELEAGGMPGMGAKSGVF